MLPQPHYPADEHCGYSGFISCTVNSSKAEDKNLSAAPCVKISGLQPQPHSRRVTRMESWHSRIVVIQHALWFSGCLLKTALEKDARPQARVTFNRFSNITPISAQTSQGGEGGYIMLVQVLINNM